MAAYHSAILGNQDVFRDAVVLGRSKVLDGGERGFYIITNYCTWIHAGDLDT